MAMMDRGALAAGRGVITTELRDQLGGSELLDEPAMHLFKATNAVLQIIGTGLRGRDLPAQSVEQNPDHRVGIQPLHVRCGRNAQRLSAQQDRGGRTRLPAQAFVQPQQGAYPRGVLVLTIADLVEGAVFRATASGEFFFAHPELVEAAVNEVQQPLHSRLRGSHPSNSTAPTTTHRQQFLVADDLPTENQEMTE